jgi:NADPH:quinone reductase-like Zn-dependent oxidoreductase
MKAFCASKYGSMDYFAIREIAKPAPKEKQVLVKVHAVSINDWDWADLSRITRGHWLARAQLGLSKPKKIVGSDIAGRVEGVGRNVTRFKPGDAVFGDLSSYIGGFGGFAEYVCAHENQLVSKPDQMTFEQAAAIPQAGVLALQALAAGGGLRPGQTILINGAGGGCGTMGIQLAKLADVEVTGVDSAEKLELMRSLGFDHVIDYNKEDFTRNGKLYDLIVDTKTSRPASAIDRVLAPGGTYATVGGTAHLFGFIVLRCWIRWRYKKNMFIVLLKPNSGLAKLCALFEASKFKPLIDQLYNFTDADVLAAFRRFGAGEHKGKIVVTVSPRCPTRPNEP